MSLFFRFLLYAVTIAAACSGQPGTESKAAHVTGTVTYRQRIALTPDAQLTVKLVDISLQDAPAVTVAEQIIDNPGQLPISYDLTYEPEDIDPRHTYAVQARITSGGKLQFTTTRAYLVLTGGHPEHVDLVLDMVGQ